jgi:iron complex outermembrane receptor protein
MHNSTIRHLLSGAAAIGLVAVAAPSIAFAQGTDEKPATAQDQEGKSSDDIVVTARRRGEASLDVPVVVNAFSGAQLDERGVSSITDIAKLVPQLSVENNVGSFGGFNTLRGVTSPTSNVTADPAVIVVVDNIPISTGSVNRLGQFDLGRVEVLKGPQALFFGKNSSGGIISLGSADPTNEFEVKLTGEYEFNAREWQGTGIISGPLSDTLRGRIAVKGLTQRGYFFNQAPGAKHVVGPDPKEIAFRGTLIYEPLPDLTIKVKGTYDHVKDNGTYFITQRMFCPSGVPTGASSSPTITDCKIDKYFARGDLPKNLDTLTGDPLFRKDGAPYSWVRQALFSMDVNYRIAPGVAFNAITGYYDLDQAYSDSIVRGPNPTLSTTGSTRKTTFSQEVRLSSEGPSRFNWMFGGFYQHDEIYDTEHVVGFNPATSVITPRQRSFWRIPSETLSGFGQASYEVVDGLTFSGGARYTSETKRQTSNLSNKFLPKIKFTNVSPEATVTYKPVPNVNFFASYKEGYKSGTFQVGSLTFLGLIPNPAVTVIDNSYRDENASGFEGGVKLALLDRSLRIDTAVYSYLYKNLQLSSFDPVQSITRISNAAAARVKGAEISVNFNPRGAPGLRLFGALSYNKSTYKDFIAACFLGQTIAQGCTIDGPDAGTVPDLQNFAGRPLLRAPKWSGNLGFSYDFDLGSTLKAGINSALTYQSSSILSQEAPPWGIRPDTTLLDAGVRIGSADGSWEVALIGKNLTDKQYAYAGFQESGTGNAATTGTTVGAPADYTGEISRGREIRLRVTLRPNLF